VGSPTAGTARPSDVERAARSVAPASPRCRWNCEQPGSRYMSSAKAPPNLLERPIGGPQKEQCGPHRALHPNKSSIKARTSNFGGAIPDLASPTPYTACGGPSETSRSSPSRKPGLRAGPGRCPMLDCRGRFRCRPSSRNRCHGVRRTLPQPWMSAASGAAAAGVRKAASAVHSTGSLCPQSGSFRPPGGADPARLTSAVQQPHDVRGGFRCAGTAGCGSAAVQGDRPLATAGTAARGCGCPVGCRTGRCGGVRCPLLLPEPQPGVRTVGVCGYRKWSPGRVCWSGAATADRPGPPGAAVGRRAGRARRSWPAAPAPGPPRRSARQAGGPAGRRAPSRR
jgi:hypothetical protein